MKALSIVSKLLVMGLVALLHNPLAAQQVTQEVTLNKLVRNASYDFYPSPLDAAWQPGEEVLAGEPQTAQSLAPFGFEDLQLRFERKWYGELNHFMLQIEILDAEGAVQTSFITSAITASVHEYPEYNLRLLVYPSTMDVLNGDGDQRLLPPEES